MRFEAFTWKEFAASTETEYESLSDRLNHAWSNASGVAIRVVREANDASVFIQATAVLHLCCSTCRQYWLLAATTDSLAVLASRAVALPEYAALRTLSSLVKAMR
jgi:hypothetical protein